MVFVKHRLLTATQAVISRLIGTLILFFLIGFYQNRYDCWVHFLICRRVK